MAVDPPEPQRTIIPPAQVRKALRATELDSLVLTTTLERALAWGSTNSIWPFGFGLACCAMEMIGVISSPRYDIARFGSEVVRATPRQSDLIIVSGRVAHKMAEPIRQLYEQMLEPKWVMAMGACASTAGMFANYAVLQGVDKIIPVDVYVPGCPPRPESVMDGLITLQKKLRAGVPHAYTSQESDA